MQFLSPNNLVWFILFIVPGFVAHIVYTLKCPAKKVDRENLIFASVAFSTFNLLLWFRLVGPIIKMPPEQWDYWEISLCGIIVLFVSPFFLAWLCAWLRKREKILRFFGFDHPTRRGWDFFMENNNEFHVLFHLKNGKLLGGYFGGNSFAAIYPDEPDIYVERIYRVDENGKFFEEFSGSLGAYIRASDWDRVEFLKISKGGVDDERSETEVGKQDANPDGGETG